MRNSHELSNLLDGEGMGLLDLEKAPKVKEYLNRLTGYSLLKPIPSDRMIISLNNNQVASFNTGLSVCGEDWHYLYRTNLVPN